MPLQVVYPGRHTFDHGPDFRDALLVFGDRLVRGDVEVHVRTGDWRSHGHQHDGYYDRVVLHVVWRDEGPPALTEAGQLLPLLALEQRVVEQPEDGGDTEEDGMERSWPCTRRAEGAKAEALATLTMLGEERLAEKAAVFEAALAVADAAQTLYGALLDALGYTANRAPCRELALVLPWPLLCAALAGASPGERVAALEALLLGCAGLLPSQRDLRRALAEEEAAYAEQLARRWSALNTFWRLTPLSAKAWRFARVRPENFPPRRLAAAARLFVPFVACDLPAALLGVLRSELPEDVPAALAGALVVPAEGFWATHCDFGGRLAAPSQLIGQGRAADVAVNVILPFAVAYGEAHGEPVLAARARAAYRLYPALGENELTRYVARLVFGRLPRRGILAAQQQGLLHAYHRFCREKRCGDCALNPATV